MRLDTVSWPPKRCCNKRRRAGIQATESRAQRSGGARAIVSRSPREQPRKFSRHDNCLMGLGLCTRGASALSGNRQYNPFGEGNVNELSRSRRGHFCDRNPRHVHRFGGGAGAAGSHHGSGHQRLRPARFDGVPLAGRQEYSRQNRRRSVHLSVHCDRCQQRRSRYRHGDIAGNRGPAQMRQHVGARLRWIGVGTSAGWHAAYLGLTLLRRAGPACLQLHDDDGGFRHALCLVSRGTDHAAGADRVLPVALSAARIFRIRARSSATAT